MQEDNNGDPNYLVVTIGDYVKATQHIADRAGVLLGVTAIILTTILVLNADARLIAAESLYQYFLPLVFLSGAFFSYARALINLPSVMPYGWLYSRAQERSVVATNPTHIMRLKQSRDLVASQYDKKRNALKWGNSIFFIAIALFVVVNLITYRVIEDSLQSNLLLAALLFAIIGILGVILIKEKLFTAPGQFFDLRGMEFPDRVQPIVGVGISQFVELRQLGTVELTAAQVSVTPPQQGATSTTTPPTASPSPHTTHA